MSSWRPSPHTSWPPSSRRAANFWADANKLTKFPFGGTNQLREWKTPAAPSFRRLSGRASRRIALRGAHQPLAGRGRPAERERGGCSGAGTGHGEPPSSRPSAASAGARSPSAVRLRRDRPAAAGADPLHEAEVRRRSRRRPRSLWRCRRPHRPPANLGRRRSVPRRTPRPRPRRRRSRRRRRRLRRRRSPAPGPPRRSRRRISTTITITIITTGQRAGQSRRFGRARHPPLIAGRARPHLYSGDRSRNLRMPG